MLCHLRQVGIKREDTGVKLFKRMTMNEYRRLHGNSVKKWGG